MADEGSETAFENQCIAIAWPHADRAGSNMARVFTYKGDRQLEGQGRGRLQPGAAYTESGAFFWSKVVSLREGCPACVLKPGPGATTKKSPKPTQREREAVQNSVNALVT